MWSHLHMYICVHTDICICVLLEHEILEMAVMTTVAMN